MTSDIFQNLARWKVEHGGTSMALPYPYYDNLSLTGAFTASSAAARRLMAQPDLFPIELWPGRCLVGLVAFEYRQTEQEPYNEIAITFLVSHKRKKLPFFSAIGILTSPVIPSYVWQLPVTTEAARAGGVDLWGFPKFIADIQFSKDADWIGCVLAQPQGEILRLRGRVLPTRPGNTVRFVSYSVLEGVLVMSNSLFHRLAFAQTMFRPDMEVVIGDGHPLCQGLRELQLSRRPLAYQYSPSSQSVLFAARNLVDV